MTDNEYKEKMDTLTQSLSIAFTVGSVVTDEDIAHMEKTISLAESVGFIFVKPLEHAEKMENLKPQKEVIRLHKALRQFFAEIGNPNE